LLVAAQQIAMTPFDRARPPWEVMLFEGLPDGKAAYLLKMHHATADGLGVVSLLGRLHSRQREHDPNKQQRDAPGADSPNPLGAIARQAQEDLVRIRRYHEALGQPVEVIPMAIPVSVRKPEDPEGTNRIASARIAGPVGIADPTSRMQRIGELLGEARGEPAIEASGPWLRW